jgi:hypothetical protein
MQSVLSHTMLLARGLDQAFLIPELAVWGTSQRGHVAEKLLALLTSSTVRKGSLEQMEFGLCVPELLGAINRCVQADKPVQLTLMAFPFKVPNPAKVGPRQLPDLAELAALVRLHQLNLKAKSIYPPGLEIHVIHDGSYIAGVFGVRLEEVRRYESYFAQLVRTLDVSRFIHLHDFEVLLAACVRDWEEVAERLRKSTLNWWRGSHDTELWKNRFSKTLGMIDLRCLPIEEVTRLLDCGVSGRLPAEYLHLERRVRVAMLRYYAHDALLHECDPRPLCFPDAIHATTQCRRRRLAIWMVNRGHSLLPWHGVGVVNRKAKWGVALAREVLGNRAYSPVFLDGEDTPFFYQQHD